MSPASKAYLESIAAAHAAELRSQRDLARYVFRADHPQLIELHRQAADAETALRELRAEPAQLVAA